MRLSQPIYQLKRKAKLLARETAIPLHEAQDRIARSEGFDSWSLLSARMKLEQSATSQPVSMLPDLVDGELALVAARPGQGKTLIGLQLLIDAVRAGRRAVFFTLEFTEAQALDLLDTLGAGSDQPEIVAAGGIDAAAIQRHLADAPRGTVVVVDYLQAMDQRRDTPPLAEQIAALQAFGRDTGVILAFIAQVDRAFAADAGALPDIADLRLPNPVPIELFAKAGFTHHGKTEVRAID